VCSSTYPEHSRSSGGEAVDSHDENDLLCFMRKKPSLQIDSASEVDRYLSVRY